MGGSILILVVTFSVFTPIRKMGICRQIVNTEKTVTYENGAFNHIDGPNTSTITMSEHEHEWSKNC